MTHSGDTASTLLHNDELDTVMDLLYERAERTPDDERLVASFVDPGVIPRIRAPKHQIIYGRRGTGKTHLLKAYGREVARSGRRSIPIYIDLSNIGDTELAGAKADPDDVAPLLRHVLVTLSRDLMDALRYNPAKGGRLEAHFNRLDDLIQSVRVRDPSLLLEDERTDTWKDSANLTATLGKDPSIKAGVGSEESAKTRERAQTSGRAVAYINFTDLNRTMHDLMAAAEVDSLVLLLDEWSDVDPEIQPDLADFVFRAFPREVVLKFGAIAYRSRFSRPVGLNRQIGLEHGSDVAQGVDLDDFFLIERRDGHIAELFSRLLFQHVSVAAAFATLDSEGPGDQKLNRRIAELLTFGKGSADIDAAVRELAALVDAESWWGTKFMERVGVRYMREHFGAETHEAFRDALFASAPLPAFHEVVQASGGVVRDFLKLTVRAYREQRRRGADDVGITVPAIRTAASELYDAEKLPNLEGHEQEELDDLVHAARTESGTRFLAVPVRGEWAGKVAALFDRRLIHRVARGYTATERGSRRHDIYSLDYAVYTELLGPDEAADDHYPEPRESPVDRARIAPDFEIVIRFVEDV